MKPIKYRLIQHKSKKVPMPPIEGLANKQRLRPNEPPVYLDVDANNNDLLAFWQLEKKINDQKVNNSFEDENLSWADSWN